MSATAGIDSAMVSEKDVLVVLRLFLDGDTARSLATLSLSPTNSLWSEGAETWSPSLLLLSAVN